MHSGSFAERFRTTTIGGRKCSAQVSVRQACREIGPAEKLMEKPGVEAVTRAHWINDRYRHGGCADSLPIPNRDRAASAHFDDNGFHHLRQPRQSSFQIVGPGHLHRFALVRQQDIHIRQDLLKDFVPVVLRIVVGIERGSQPGGLHPPKKLGHMRQQFTLQEQR